MTSIKYAETVSIFRGIRRELTKIVGNKAGEKDASVEHMLDLLRANQVTEKRFCRPEDHYKYFAETYLTYLKSSRQHAELLGKYYNKGDRNIQDSARAVGLELPKQPTPLEN